MVGLSSDPGTHFYFHLLAAAAGALVVADILVEDSVHAEGLVMTDPLPSDRNLLATPQ